MLRVFYSLAFLLLLFLNNVKSQQVLISQDSIRHELLLNELTVSATRFAENPRFLSQQVFTINARKNTFLNQQSTADILSQTGHVLVQKSQMGGGSPVLRGFEANKLLLVVDGVRMNNAIYRGGHLQNVITMDNAILDKTEILFGPASVLYGSDALGGVISFFTRNPELKEGKGKTQFSAQSFTRYSTANDEKTGHVEMQVSGYRVGSLTSFTYSDFGDLRQGSNYYKKFPDWGKSTFYSVRINAVDSMIKNENTETQSFTGYKQYDLLQKFIFKTGRKEHIINLQYSTSSNINRYDRLTELTSTGNPRNAVWYYGPQKRLLAAWTLNLSKTRLYDEARIVSAYQHIVESRHNRNFGSNFLNNRTEKLHIGSINADFSRKNKKIEFGYGAEVTYNNVQSDAFSKHIVSALRKPLDTRYPDGGSNTRSMGAYARVLYKFSNSIVMNAGARFTANYLYSKFKDSSFFPFPFKDIEQKSNAVTGNIGIVFFPEKSWKISANVSNGFRTPNVDDMSKVFESGNGNLIIPNARLKPEKTTNYEISIAKNVSNRLNIGFTAWYTDYRNSLSTDFTTFNGSSTILYNGVTSNITTVVNKKRAYLYGFSGNIDAILNSHFTFSSVLNYTFGRIKEIPSDYPLDHIAPLFGRSAFTGKFGKFTAEIFAMYNGTKDSADYNLRGEDNHVFSADRIRGFSPAWVTLNFRSTFSINKSTSIQLATENIFDTYYRIFASGISAPGRNIVLTLRAGIN